MSTGIVFDTDSYMRLDQTTWYETSLVRDTNCDEELCLTDIRSYRADVFGDFPINKTHITYKSESPEQYADLFLLSKATEAIDRKRLMFNMHMSRVERIPHMRPQKIDWNIHWITYVSIGGCNRHTLVSYDKKVLFRE